MTTLPQTSPLRLPRPGGSSMIPMAPAAMGPVAVGPAGTTNNALTGADVMRVLRSNLWLIILTLIVAGGAGYGANMWLAAKHTRYTSTGYLAVYGPGDMPHPDNPFSATSAPQQEVEMEQHATTAKLKHPTLITRVMSNADSPIRQTQWFGQFVNTGGKSGADVDAATQDLLEHLDVSPIQGSRLVAVSMTYSNPRDCQTIVNEVCSQHIKDMMELYNAGQIGLTDRMETLKNEYQNELRDTRNKINKIIDELGKGGSTIGNGIQGSKELELSSLTSEQVRAESALIEAATKLQKFRALAKQDVTLPEVDEEIERDTAYFEMRRIADEAHLDLEQRQQQLGATHPSVVAMKARVDSIDQKVAELHEQAKTRLTSAHQYELESIAESAKVAVDSINARAQELQGQIIKLAGRRSEYERLVVDERDLTEKLAKVKNEQERMASLLQSGTVSKVEWSTRPDMPTMPTFPRLSITLSAALALGLVLSLGIAFLREVTDTTVRSPRDIARVGQLSLLGMIPHESDDPQSANARLPLAIFEAPYSIIAEQFRQVRTRLQHAASLDTTRSILVTGCSPGDGKSTVACNLAAGLALNGRRILLVDANFRRPTLHNTFNINNDAGFGDVLNSPEQFDTLIAQTEVPNLSVLVAGQRPSNPTELLESQLLIDFTERALEEFDHVIFDSGPLLMVSESNALAPRVDGVITVVRAHGNSRGLLQRMRDQLRVLKAEHLGVILNAVRSQGGGYYGPMIKSYYAYQNPE